jgi:phosphate-selective porin OprO/OprP
MAIGTLIFITSPAWSKAPAIPTTTPTTAPTSAPAAAEDPADCKATLEALKKKIEAQDRRIAELEAKQGDDQKMRRAEIIAVLKEMNLLNDKKAGDMRVYYKEGLKFETADGNFRMGINGRIYDDWAFISARGVSKTHRATPQTDGTELREARIMLSGDIYKDYFYCVELDFAHSAVAPKDIYFGMKNIPVVGNVRVGHFKEPFSLDDLTGDSALTFMERALPYALVPDRNDGIMANNAILNQRMTWAAGVFRNTGGSSGTDKMESDKGWDLTARVTGLPYYANNGKQLIHLGVAYSYESFNDPQTVTYSSAPEIDSNLTNGLKYISTDTIRAKGANLFDDEVATVWNSFHAESEIVASRVDTASGGNPCYKGFYAQAGYFLTGEVRPYNRATGTFDRVRPLKNFREDGGLGAWEIAARYSYLDLDEQRIGKDRGTLNDVTVGVNWYLNPMIRVMWDYIHVMPDTALADESADIFMMRFQIDF